MYWQGKSRVEVLFRRFKDKLYDLNLEKHWYQYRDEAYEKSQRNGVKDIRLILLNKRKGIL